MTKSSYWTEGFGSPVFSCIWFPSFLLSMNLFVPCFSSLCLCSTYLFFSEHLDTYHQVSFVALYLIQIQTMIATFLKSSDKVLVCVPCLLYFILFFSLSLRWISVPHPPVISFIMFIMTIVFAMLALIFSK